MVIRVVCASFHLLLTVTLEGVGALIISISKVRKPRQRGAESFAHSPGAGKKRTFTRSFRSSEAPPEARLLEAHKERPRAADAAGFPSGAGGRHRQHSAQGGALRNTPPSSLG